MSAVVFDIGANDGNSSFPIVNAYKNVTVYAFEPTPTLLPRLENMQKSCERFKLFPCAVSNVEGFINFNLNIGDEWVGVGESGHGGTNSVYAIQRKEFSHCKVGKTIEVPVIRLEKFIDDHSEINQIDYFHCDVQGLDLEVLQGLGKHLSKVKRGCLEMPLNYNTRIYPDQKYDCADAVRFLHENGFIVDRIDRNDDHVCEVNIYFSRLDENKRVKSVRWSPITPEDIWVRSRLG